MAVKYVAIKCPFCGADFKNEENREKLFCPYCGSKISKELKYEKVIRAVDKTGIMKTAESYESKILEFEKREQLERIELHDWNNKKSYMQRFF